MKCICIQSLNNVHTLNIDYKYLNQYLLFLYISVQKRNVLKISTNNSTALKKPWKNFANNLNKIQIEYRSRKRIPPYIYKLLAKSTKLKYARFVCSQLLSLKQFLEFLPTENLENLSIYLEPLYAPAYPDLRDQIENVSVPIQYNYSK